MVLAWLDRYKHVCDLVRAAAAAAGLRRQCPWPRRDSRSRSRSRESEAAAVAVLLRSRGIDGSRWLAGRCGGAGPGGACLALAWLDWRGKAME